MDLRKNLCCDAARVDRTHQGCRLQLCETWYDRLDRTGIAVEVFLQLLPVEFIEALRFDAAWNQAQRQGVCSRRLQSAEPVGGSPCRAFHRLRGSSCAGQQEGLTAG